MGKRSKIYDYTPEQLQELINHSTGYTDVLRKISISGGTSTKTLKRIIEEYNLDTEKLKVNRSNSRKEGIKWCRVDKKYKYSLEEILIKESRYTSMITLKKRLFESGLKNKKCEMCGIEKWNEKDIVLQLHHVNGDHIDNRIENLQVLCPNCHSQTDNHSGKNINVKTDYVIPEGFMDDLPLLSVKELMVKYSISYRVYMI